MPESIPYLQTTDRPLLEGNFQNEVHLKDIPAVADLLAVKDKDLSHVSLQSYAAVTLRPNGLPVLLVIDSPYAERQQQLALHVREIEHALFAKVDLWDTDQHLPLDKLSAALRDTIHDTSRRHTFRYSLAVSLLIRREEGMMAFHVNCGDILTAQQTFAGDLRTRIKPMIYAAAPQEAVAMLPLREGEIPVDAIRTSQHQVIEGDCLYAITRSGYLNQGDTVIKAQDGVNTYSLKQHQLMNNGSRGLQPIHRLTEIAAKLPNPNDCYLIGQLTSPSLNNQRDIAKAITLQLIDKGHKDHQSMRESTSDSLLQQISVLTELTQADQRQSLTQLTLLEQCNRLMQMTLACVTDEGSIEKRQACREAIEHCDGHPNNTLRYTLGPGGFIICLLATVAAGLAYACERTDLTYPAHIYKQGDIDAGKLLAGTIGFATASLVMAGLWFNARRKGLSQATKAVLDSLPTLSFERAPQQRLLRRSLIAMLVTTSLGCLAGLGFFVLAYLKEQQQIDTPVTPKGMESEDHRLLIAGAVIFGGASILSAAVATYLLWPRSNRAPGSTQDLENGPDNPYLPLRT